MDNYDKKFIIGNISQRDTVKIAPVEVGKEYQAEVRDISSRGEGIVNYEGFIIFVPNTKKGEQIKFKVTKIYKRFAQAKKISKEGGN